MPPTWAAPMSRICTTPPRSVPPAALLLAADPTQLPGQWVDHGMSAWFAHTNQAALALARWMLETSRAQPGTRERVTHRRRAGKVIAASLGWSEAHAARRLEFARQLLERLPALGDAMDSGRLEEHKAWLFTSTLAELDTRQARTVVDDVLPDAPRLAYGVLRERIEKAAHDTDPGWAEARRAAAIARRRVSFRVAPSGAAELCGLDLPEEPAQDAHDRIVALARHITRELRAAGHDAPVGPIQSEVMLTLTGPTGAGMWDRDVIDHVIDRFTTPDNPDDGDGPADTGPDNPTVTAPTTTAGPRTPGLTNRRTRRRRDPTTRDPTTRDPTTRDPRTGTTSTTADPMMTDPRAPVPKTVTGDGDGDGDVPGKDAPAEDHGSAEDDVPGEPTTRPTAAAEKPPWRVPFVPRVALRVGLRTVLGLDRRAGQLPRHGVVTNSVATAMAWNRTHSTFRLLLYNPDGALEHALTVHPPRRGQPPPHARQRRHHIVELIAYTHELDALAAAAADPQLALDGDPPPGGILLRGDALGLSTGPPGRWLPPGPDPSRSTPPTPGPRSGTGSPAPPYGTGSRPGTRRVAPRAAPPTPAPATSTTPSRSPRAASPAPTTSGRAADATTPSNTTPTAAGRSPRPQPAGSPGPRPPAGSTSSSPSATRPDPTPSRAATTTTPSYPGSPSTRCPRPTIHPAARDATNTATSPRPPSTPPHTYDNAPATEPGTATTTPRRPPTTASPKNHPSDGHRAVSRGRPPTSRRGRRRRGTARRCARRARSGRRG